MIKKELDEEDQFTKRIDLRNLKPAKLKFKCILETKDLKNNEKKSYFKGLFPSLNEKSINKLKNSLEEVLSNSCNLLSNKLGAVLYNKETFDNFNSLLASFYPFQSYNEYKNLNRIIFKNASHMKYKYEKYEKYYNKLILPKKINKDVNVMDKHSMKREVNEKGGNGNGKDKKELRLIINEIREKNYGDF